MTVIGSGTAITSYGKNVTVGNLKIKDSKADDDEK